MAHWAKIQPAVKELCARENGASLKEISVGIDRPFNVCSKFLSNLMEAQEIVKAGVHGEFRYFVDRDKAAQHDKEAKLQRAKQKEEAHERKKAQQAERERRKRAERREAKGLGQYVKPEPKPKKQKVEKEGREVYVRANDRYTQIKRQHLQATITKPDHVKVQYIPHGEDYRYKFVPPSKDWKGQISQDWQDRI